jgi:hypothetical protein
MPSTELYVCIQHDVTDYEVIVEDDGRVAYAYLFQGEKMLAAAWLYNRCITPDAPEWKVTALERHPIPFANSKEFAIDEQLPVFTTDSCLRDCSRASCRAGLAWRRKTARWRRFWAKNRRSIRMQQRSNPTGLGPQQPSQANRPIPRRRPSLAQDALGPRSCLGFWSSP